MFFYTIMNKKSTLIHLFYLFFTSTSVKIHSQNTNKLKWWQDAKFGLFLHWGLYSIGEWNGKPQKGNEHFMFAEHIPLKEYAKIGETFNPVNFNAEYG